MDRQCKEPAARSCRKACKRQAVGQVVGNRQVTETGVHRTLLFREPSRWKSCMSLGHTP